MVKNVLIFGAGSIGNHMTNACLKLKFNIFVTDISLTALKRMRKKVFIKRYGKWNNKIKLVNFKEVFKLKNKFELVIIGTPPISHFELYKKCKNNLNFKKILIEKPLCVFNQKFSLSKKEINSGNIFCGYNHSISPSINYLFKKIESVNPNDIEFIDIQWREGWRGIMNAHFWLKSEKDTYLGDFKKGGGALQEHSHGLHLSICLLNKFFKNKFNILDKRVVFTTTTKNKKYDKYSSILFYSKSKKLNLELDLFSLNPRKEINIYLKKNRIISWIHNFKKNNDLVRLINGGKEQKNFFRKDRSTEFISEIKHICGIDTKKKYFLSRINIIKAIECMKIIRRFF